MTVCLFAIMNYHIFGLFLFLHESYALVCFNCTYWPGHPGSTNHCKNKDPGSKYLIDCRTKTLLSSDDGYPGKSNPREVYCIKTVGIAHGKEFIYRTCAVKNWIGDRNNQCLQTNEKDEIMIPQKDNVTVQGELCYCTKKKCNVAASSSFANVYFVVFFCLFVFSSYIM